MAISWSGQDATIKRGDSGSIVLTFTDSTGAAVNLTGSTIYFTAKNNKSADSDAQAVIQKTVTSHTSNLGGISTITITSADTAITIKEYDYDVEYITTTNDVSTVLEGKFKVVQDVTLK